jgi:hypothetical protein
VAGGLGSIPASTVLAELLEVPPDSLAVELAVSAVAVLDEVILVGVVVAVLSLGGAVPSPSSYAAFLSVKFFAPLTAIAIQLK